MSMYELDEIAQRGTELIRQVHPTLRAEDDGKFIAIDVTSGEFELDQDDYTAVMRLRNRLSDAEIWLGRIGEPAAYRMRPRCFSDQE